MSPNMEDWKRSVAAEIEKSGVEQAEMGAWSAETREWLAHISTCHPVAFQGDLVAALTASAILAGTGRSRPDRVRRQVNEAIARVRREVCGACRPMERRAEKGEFRAER